MYTIIKKCGSIFYPSLPIFVEDQNEECPLTKFEQFFMCSFAEICRQHWSKEKIMNLLPIKGRENLDTVKPIYIIIELSLSLNDSLSIILAASMGIIK